MPANTDINVSDLNLDLKNPRTIPQANETEAIKALILIKPEKFYGIIESLLEDGYIPTENIIVLNEDGKYTVKEGNRRIAAMKIIHGIYDVNGFPLSQNIKSKLIQNIDEWKKNNAAVPCLVFLPEDNDKIEKILSLTHAKGESSSRDKWTSVATARYDRDHKQRTEKGLDLLEKYLLNTTTLDSNDKSLWSGDYPLTVLNEALRLVLSTTQYTSVGEFVDLYPAITFKDKLDKVIDGIGHRSITFPVLRDKNADFLSTYGFKVEINLPPNNILTSNTQVVQTTVSTPPTSENLPEKTSVSTTEAEKQVNIANDNSNKTSNATGNLAKKASKTKQASYSINDPRTVTNILKGFMPGKPDRQKVVTLKNEITELNISKNPIAFCFLVRSMFEISAKAFANENQINIHKNGVDRRLVDVLRDVTDKLTKNKTDKEQNKKLHGAITELAKNEGILSVNSMNQLVHNTTFSITPADVCITFSNIFPLLEAMN